MTERQKWFARGWVILFLTLSELGNGLFLLTVGRIPAYAFGSLFVVVGAYLSGAVIGGLVDEARNPVLREWH